MTRKLFCTTLSLGFAFAPLPAAVAGQDIIIDGTVIRNIYGNGDPSDGSATLPSGADTSGMAPAIGNTVTIRDSGNVAGYVYGGIARSAANSVEASGNSVMIVNGGSLRDPADSMGSGLMGGYAFSWSGSALAKYNTVTIDNGLAAVSIFGGEAYSDTVLADASYNKVLVKNGGVAQLDIYGGFGRSFYGSAMVTGNEVIIDGGRVGMEDGPRMMGVYGGWGRSETAPTTVTNNKVIVENGSVVDWAIYGGFACSVVNSDIGISGNSVIIRDSEAKDDVIGGGTRLNSGPATITDNTVAIDNGLVLGSVYGGFAESDSSGNASYNNVFINGGEVKGNVYGGRAGSDYDYGTGPFTATHNTVTISGNAKFDPNNTILYGGYTAGKGAGDAFTGNTLNLYAANLTVAGLQNFENLHFYVPGASAHGDTILTVTGTADLTGSGGRSSTVNVGIDGASSPLQAGEHIVLIDAGRLITNSGLNTTAHGMQGVTLLYDFDLHTQGDHYLVATVTKAPEDDSGGGFRPTPPKPGGTEEPGNGGGGTDPGGTDPGGTGSGGTDPGGNGSGGTDPGGTGSGGTGSGGTDPGGNGSGGNGSGGTDPGGNGSGGNGSGGSGPARVNPQAESLSEGFLAGIGLLNQGADLMAGAGMRTAVNAARLPTGGYGLGIFGTLSGGQSRYNTGSYADVSGISLMTGVSKRINARPGNLTLGAFFEYGDGSYDTYNSFSDAAAVRGNGDIYHLGGGILGRMDFNDNGPGAFYMEGGLRAGGVHNDYKSGDLRDSLDRAAAYDSSSAYYGAYAGLGYIWNLTDKAALDLYGKYFWTRQEGDTVRLSTGDPVTFDNVNSHRTRLGARFSYAVNESVSPYVGAAYEHEFDGKARATTNGYAIKAPSLRGGAGIGELGLTLKPSKDLPLSIDLGAQGYVGTRQGVSGTLHLRYEF